MRTPFSVLLLAIGVFSAPAFATPQDNLAIAWASSLLSDTLGDVEQWQEVDVMTGPSNAEWYVDFTTSVDFVTCPDGTVYIVRAGDGVTIRGPRDGDIYQWAEDISCDKPSTRRVSARRTPRHPLQR